MKRLPALVLSLLLLPLCARAEDVSPSRWIAKDFIVSENERLSSFEGQTLAAIPQEEYEAGGVLTFRGGPMRQNAAYGELLPGGAGGTPRLSLFAMQRTLRTGEGSTTGFGYASQPLLVRWSADQLRQMNVSDALKDGEAHTEAILPARDGRIWFFDLDTGEPSREPFAPGMPADASAAVSPSGPLLLFAGQTGDTVTVIPTPRSQRPRDLARARRNAKTRHVPSGLRAFSLLTGEGALYETGVSASRYPRNANVFSAPLFARDGSTGEEALVFTTESGFLSTLRPAAEGASFSFSDANYGYAPRIARDLHRGILASPAAFGHSAFFGDMNGLLLCADLRSMSCVWVRNLGDSVVCAPALERDADGLFLYAGTVINRGKNSRPILMEKLDARTGQTVWQVKTAEKGTVSPRLARAHRWAGVQASPLLPGGDCADLVIFSVNRLKGGAYGDTAVLLALDRRTGQTVWSRRLGCESLSSPIALIRGDTGEALILCGDDDGTLTLLQGRTGEVLDALALSGPVEASPAAFGNRVAVGTANGLVFFVDVNL